MESTRIVEDDEAQIAAMDPKYLQVPSIVQTSPQAAGYHSLRSSPESDLPTDPNDNTHLNAGEDGHRSMDSSTELLLPAAEPNDGFALPNSAQEVRSSSSQVPLLDTESNDQTQSTAPVHQKMKLVQEKLGGRTIYKLVVVDDDSPPYPEYGPGNPIIQRDPFKLRQTRVTGYSGEVKVRCFPPLPNAAYELNHDPATPNPASSPALGQSEYILQWGFENERAGDLTVEAGDVITVVYKRGDGWWEVTDRHGNTGFVPGNYLEPKTDSQPAAQQTHQTAVPDTPSRSDSHNLDESYEADDGLLGENGVQRGRSQGEILAETITFLVHDSSDFNPGVSGLLYPLQEQREDFIRNIDAGFKWEYCKKCGDKHILPGPPRTLPDRDTCGAYLPQWFHNLAGPSDNPWESFQLLLNRWVREQEVKQGYMHKGTRFDKEWDLKFHDEDLKWREVGRREGWWKCRSGTNAPEVERNCILCHSNPKPLKSPQFNHRGEDINDRIKAYLNGMIEDAGKEDKKFVLDKIRKEGIEQFLGDMVRAPRD